MPPSKRTRFEVLRRDDHTCRYCGAKAPQVHLHVDHVVPVALGGTDAPSNLVTACVDCNRGKASVPLSAQKVDDIAEDALRWAKAMEAAGAIAVHEQNEREEYSRNLTSTWRLYDGDYEFLPADYDRVTTYWRTMHVPPEIIVESVHVAWTSQVPDRNVFRYLVGVLKNRITEQTAAAHALLAAAKDEEPAGGDA